MNYINMIIIENLIIFNYEIHTRVISASHISERFY